jgi:hypothetical protein
MIKRPGGEETITRTARLEVLTVKRHVPGIVFVRVDQDHNEQAPGPSPGDGPDVPRADDADRRRESR